MAQILAVLAVGAAAVSFVAGLGTYLSIRFTQHRRQAPQPGRSSAGQRPAAGEPPAETYFDD